jgi:hypothetical protein
MDEVEQVAPCAAADTAQEMHSPADQIVTVSEAAANGSVGRCAGLRAVNKIATAMRLVVSWATIECVPAGSRL